MRYTPGRYSAERLPKISDAENAVQSLSADLRLAGSSSQLLLFRAQLLERFRRFESGRRVRQRTSGLPVSRDDEPQRRLVGRCPMTRFCQT